MSARKVILWALVLTLSLSLTGCMGASDDNAAATAKPSRMPAVTAEATGIPGSVEKNGTNFDWNRQAQTVETALNQLSEISDARVAIAGNTALVGVKFDSAYQGEMTERIREMVSGVVKNADPSIQVVAVTATEKDVTSIFDIADRVRAGAGEVFDDFKDDINTIVRNATTMR